MKLKQLPLVATILVVVGAINWGLVGLSSLVGGTNWNLVNLLFGTSPALESAVYVLVGLAGAWFLWDWYAKSGKR